MNTLLETLLTSEYKFGFELEAYINEDIIGNYEDYDEDYDEYYFNQSALFNELTGYFGKWFGYDNEVINDGSLDSDKGGFEYPTPPMNLTPQNIKKCVDFLDNLPKSPFKIYTTDDCGFHVHLSFPKMSLQDAVWIVCHIALNDKLKQDLKHFESIIGNKDYDFQSNWAEEDYLDEIGEGIKDNDWIRVSSYISNEKYRLLRIHPQGTIEWRGPRNFLTDENKEIIKEFFIKLVNIVKNITLIMDKKDIEGISKENFFKFIHLDDVSFGKPNRKFNEDKINTIIKKPHLLADINFSKYNIHPTNLIRMIKLMLPKHNKSFKDFLVDLRYKKFKSTSILKSILEQEPSFINYVNEDPMTLLKKLVNVHDNPYNYLFKSCLTSDLLISILKFYTNEVYASLTFIKIMEDLKRRINQGLSPKPFLEPNAFKYICSKAEPSDKQYLKILINQTANQTAKTCLEKFFKFIA